MKKKSYRRLARMVLATALTVSSLSPATMAAAAENTGAAVTAEVSLKDIGKSYAEKEIQALVKSGIIGGYEDGTFRPTEPMTRAQLAKVLVLSLGLQEAPENADSFADVPKDAWFKGFIGALVKSGITDGTSSTTFSPNEQVSREQLAVFFIRAFGLEAQAKQVKADVALKDLNDIAEWARPHVALAFKMGFIQGISNSDGTISFSPKASAERQALARLAYEFHVNRDSYKAKADEIAKANPDGQKPEVTTPETTTPIGGGGGGGSKRNRDVIAVATGASVVSATSIEVTFNANGASTSTGSYTLEDTSNVVTNPTGAAWKTGSSTVVVLTTNSLTAGKIYTLKYNGAVVKKFAYNSNIITSINDSATLNGDYTIDKGVTTFGPATPSAKATITGTLYVDPGAAGTVTIRNVDATNIVVLSGDSNSVNLNNVTAQQLTVNAAGQSNPVHISGQGATQIQQTTVGSKVILESSASNNLGDISIDSTAAGQTIALKGNIGNVTVNANNTNIEVRSQGTNLTVPTGVSVGTLTVSSNAVINANGNIGSLQAEDEHIVITVQGDNAAAVINAAKTDAENTINALPADNAVTLDNRAAVKAARGKYNAAKAMGANPASTALDKLAAVELKLRTLAKDAVNAATDAVKAAELTQVSHIAAARTKIDALKKAIEVAKEVGIADFTAAIQAIEAAEAKIAMLQASNFSISSANGVFKTYVFDVAKEVSVQAQVGAVSGSKQEVKFNIPGGATAHDKLTKLYIYSRDAASITFTQGITPIKVDFDANGVALVDVSKVLNGVSLDPDNDGASVGNIRQAIEAASGTLSNNTGVLKNKNGQEVGVTLTVTASPEVNLVQSATVKVGTQTVDIPVTGGKVINYTIPTTFTDLEMVKQLTLKATGTPDRLVIAVPIGGGMTENTVSFKDSTEITTSVAGLLTGHYDPNNDGVSVGTFRTFLSNTGASISAALIDKQGFARTIVVNLSAQQ